MIGVHALRSLLFAESWEAAANLSAKQFYVVIQDTDGKINVPTSVVDVPIGVLDNAPASGRIGRVIHSGIAKVVSDGSSDNISRGSHVQIDSTGRAVLSDSNRAFGIALTPSTTAGGLISVLLMLHPIQQQNEHLYLLSDPANKKQVRIGTEVGTHTSDTHMGFSSKPDLEGDGSANITGAEISPRISNGGSGSSMYGIDINLDIKSDASSAVLSSEFCGLKVKLECNSALVTTITGNASCLRCEPALSGNQTVSGKYVPIIVRDATQQGVGKNWDGFALIGADGGVATNTGVPNTVAGSIKVIIGSTDKWIALYTTSTGG